MAVIKQRIELNLPATCARRMPINLLCPVNNMSFMTNVFQLKAVVRNMSCAMRTERMWPCAFRWPKKKICIPSKDIDIRQMVMICASSVVDNGSGLMRLCVGKNNNVNGSNARMRAKIILQIWMGPISFFAPSNIEVSTAMPRFNPTAAASINS